MTFGYELGNIEIEMGNLQAEHNQLKKGFEELRSSLSNNSNRRENFQQQFNETQERIHRPLYDPNKLAADINKNMKTYNDIMFGTGWKN